MFALLSVGEKCSLDGRIPLDRSVNIEDATRGSITSSGHIAYSSNLVYYDLSQSSGVPKNIVALAIALHSKLFHRTFKQ